MKKNFIIVLLALRWPNLLLTGLTIILCYFLVLIPIVEKHNLILNLDSYGILILTFSTLFIMAGGYVINDWMDVESDLVNNKKSQLKVIPRKTLLINYLILSFLGLGLGFYLSMLLGRIELWSVHLLAFLLLLVYSTNLKSTPLAGNIVISLLCGLIPVLPLVFNEVEALFSLDGKYVLLLFLGFFAFLINLIRELIKDMEDELGDRQTNLATFPVVFGMEAAKWTSFIFYLFYLLLLISMLYLEYDKSAFSFAYLTITTFLPMLYLTYKLKSAKTKKDFHFQSTAIKIVMLAGILFTIVNYLIQYQ